ncbi:MAG: hypothetical protein AB7N24_11400 [Dehalococcoidia bacterium]
MVGVQANEPRIRVLASALRQPPPVAGTDVQVKPCGPCRGLTMELVEPL